MPYNFDERIERRGTDSMKWSQYDGDVLPMWVADMDFRSPEPVIQALHDRADQGVFGYPDDVPQLREAICERMQALYDWKVEPKQILFVPGLVMGLNLVNRAVGKSGDGVLMLTPIYPPFLTAPPNNARFASMVEMAAVRNGRSLHYEIDYDALESAITGQTRLFLLCNPHNPVGRVYSGDELERLAAICLKHEVAICSDEIHCDLLLDGNQHIPLASLSPEIAQNTVTLMAPSKTFNLPGLFCGFAIVQNEELRKPLEAMAWSCGHVNVLGYAAALAAYRDGQDWLDELLVYLQHNRDALAAYVEECLPDIAMTHVEGTYLAWLDCRNVGIKESTPYEFFLKAARVALGDGAAFGRGGEGFIRLNFGCPRDMLTEALERMRAALEKMK